MLLLLSGNASDDTVRAVGLGPRIPLKPKTA
jgi:hypothetical protein